MRGRPGHSRKIELRRLLGLVEGQAVSAVIEEAMAVFGVGTRSVEQTVADLEWGGYLERQRVGEQARRSDLVVLTEKGRRAVVDAAVATDLISLPQRHRNYRAALRDSGHPDHVEAMLIEWRRGMGRDGAECESPARPSVRPETRLGQSGVSAIGIREIFRATEKS
jgi:hypothetical protein